MIIWNEIGKKIKIKENIEQLVINESDNILVEGNNCFVEYLEISNSKNIILKNIVTNAVSTIYNCKKLEIKGNHFYGLLLRNVESSNIVLNDIFGDLELINSSNNRIIYNKNICKENVFYQSNYNDYLHNVIDFERLSLIDSDKNRFMGNLPFKPDKDNIIVIEENSKFNIFDHNLVTFEDKIEKLKKMNIR